MIVLSSDSNCEHFGIHLLVLFTYDNLFIKSEFYYIFGFTIYFSNWTLYHEYFLDLVKA